MQSSDTRRVQANCACGAANHEITLSISAFPLPAAICHCWSCRHMTGALCLTSVQLPESYSPSKELVDELVPHQVSRRLTFYHCKGCGSHMLIHCWKDADHHGKGQSWEAGCGTLEQADGVFILQLHEFIGDTLDGGFSDFLPSIKSKTIPRWSHQPDEGKQLPLYWQCPQRPKITPSPSGKLHCRCQCNGVNFWIARPSERSKQAQSAWPDLIVPHHSTAPRANTSCWWLRHDCTKFLGGVCCCNSCRLDSEMEWIQWAFIPTIDISLDHEGEKKFELPFGTLQSYHSTPAVTRYFCGTCGATVFYTNDEREGLVDVGVGVLDAPEGARAESWLHFWTHRLSYREDAAGRADSIALALETGLKQFGEKQRKK